MTFDAGAKLGSYEILGLLGAGGMGEVYRARDTKLKREVAIKVLPDTFSRDAERVSRFQREAEVLASLNHPHIAAIYDFADAAGSRFLVLELVDGETLADRIARGPIPIEEALQIARQIAEALEAAHEKGITHRDLKPANIKITPDGNVKVLDFGLAKVRHTDPNLSDSPTALSETLPGVIMGTAAYMSPEQAGGKLVDSRTDIWAFGCVLYQMLSGRQAFDGGDTVAQLIAVILTRDPDWEALPAATPTHIRTLLRRCLHKDPHKRLPHIGVARIEIDEGAMEGQVRGSAVSEPRLSSDPTRRRRALLILTAAIFAALATAVLWWSLRQSSAPREVVRLSFPLPEKGAAASAAIRRSIAISPDGTQVVYAAEDRLYLRAMSESAARPIPGSESTAVWYPVFSPDSQSIAFWALSDRTIKHIATNGGTAVTMGQVDLPFGLSWGPDGLVVADRFIGIRRLPAQEGSNTDLLIGLKTGEQLNEPQILPGGNAVLFTVSTTTGSNERVVVQSLESGDRKTLVEGGSSARYLPTGHIVYAVGGILSAQLFDIDRLEMSGEPRPIIEGVQRFPSPALDTNLSVSNTGTLVYLPGSRSTAVIDRTIALLDRNGTRELLKIPPGPYGFPRLSPDGTRVAFGTDDGKEADISIYDLNGASSIRRLTFGGRNRLPIWSADGRRVAFQSDREGDLGIFSQAAEGGTAERLTPKPEQGASQVPESWSPNGDQLLFSVTRDSRTTLWTFSIAEKKATRFAQVESPMLTSAVFSPDGRWVAYASRETGKPRFAVYVQPFPATGEVQQISREDDGHHPLWSRDGREILYIPGPNLFSVVTVATQPSFAFGLPKAIAGGFLDTLPSLPRGYDMTADGKRIIAVVPSGQGTTGTSSVPQAQVVLNWFEELKQRVPAK